MKAYHLRTNETYPDEFFAGFLFDSVFVPDRDFVGGIRQTHLKDGRYAIGTWVYCGKEYTEAGNKIVGGNLDGVRGDVIGEFEVDEQTFRMMRNYCSSKFYGHHTEANLDISTEDLRGYLLGTKPLLAKKTLVERARRLKKRHFG